MKLNLRKLALLTVLLIAAAPTAFSQNHSKPSKVGETKTLCTGCAGKNAAGEPSIGLPLWQYSDPLTRYVGRLVDSVEVRDIQSPFRTVRAKKMIFAEGQRGTAPPRIYFQLGSSIGVYSLDTFFTSTVPAGMTDVNVLVGAKRPADPGPEKLVKWGAFIYPEHSTSGWKTYMADGQDRLFDLDYDDRGHVYAAAGPFGWGIVKDDGRSAGGHLPLVKQMATADDPSGVTPMSIVSLRSGGRYWAVIGDGSMRAVFDVTDASNPALRFRFDKPGQQAFSAAKAESAQRIAYITGEGKLAVSSYDDFLKGNSPIAQFSPVSGRFRGLTATPDGTFWSSSPSTLYRFRPSGDTYVVDTYAPGPGSFTGEELSVRDGYLVVVGRTSQIELRLFKIESGGPAMIDMGDYFSKHYHRAPSGYGNPFQGELAVIFGAHVYKQNGKTYLIYNTGALSDVYEIQTGDSISASRKSGTYGSANPYARSVETGPFYGDVLGFTATSSNPLGVQVEWDFKNPEGPEGGIKRSSTGNTVEYQYTGLTSENAIKATKSVTVTAVTDSSMSATVPVTMLAPTARIGVTTSTGAATDIAIASDAQLLELVPGQKLTDASDGEIEGHFSEWTIDNGAAQLKAPDDPVDIGGYGPHSARLVAKYGVYSPAFENASPFSRSRTLNFEVRPFTVALKPATKSGTVVTFHAAAAIASGLTGTWDGAWTLQTPSTTDTDLTLPFTAVAVGTIPPFPVSTQIENNSILKLTVTLPQATVDGLQLPAGLEDYASRTLEQVLTIPDPTIQRTGCAETGAPCSFRVTNAASDWTINWELKLGSQVVKTSSANPFEYSITSAGTYTISAVASTSVFSSAPKQQSFPVTAPACANPPSNVDIWTSCDNCAVNEEVLMEPSIFGYSWSDCEEMEWTFGDGQQTLTKERTVAHKYASSGSKTIKLRVKKGSQYSSSVSRTIKIGSSEPPPPPPPTCNAPANITVTYTGSRGCRPGTACKVGEMVTFTARRGSSSLHDCDSVSWSHQTGSTSNRVTYSEAGNFTATATVTNQYGSDSGTANVQVVPDSTGCSTPPANSTQVYVEYYGAQSGCNDAEPNKPCTKGEKIDFSVRPFIGYQIQSCDSFEWDMGDSSAKKSGLDVSHTYQTNAPSVRGTLRVYNSSNTTGNSITFNVPFSNVPVKPLPVLSFPAFPTTGSKGNAVTFTVNSNIPATGWTWTFGDGATESQTTHVGTSSTITHTYANTGSFTVTVRARNAEEVVSNPPTNSATGTIVIDEIPEFRYLLPVAVHAPGQGGSAWRTDVQIYNPDPNVSAENPLNMTATFNGLTTQLHIAQSTYVYEDFVQRLTTADAAQGPVIITTKAKYAPQIWTRTYNQAENGTFGQFIPAIRLDTAGGGAAVGEGRYFLAGLRSDVRYRTNIGLVNPTNQQLTATVRAFDEAGLPIANGTFTRTLNPYQLDQFPIGSVIANFPADHAFSLEIEVGAGQWVIAYASFIDGGSNDPIFLQAARESELVSEDYRTIVIPGVGHTGAWRSDVAIYNSNGRGIAVDLAYHDATGAKVGEAANVPIAGGAFLQYADIVKQGVLGGNVPDGLGMLRVTVPTGFSTERFPMAYARTYNDDGSGKTYGQGIAAFAAARPNVSETITGLIPGVRSKAGEYYTNVFVTNVTDTKVLFSIKVLDRTTGAQVREDVAEVGPYQTVTFGKYDLGGESASLKIQATGKIWAYASIVDDRTKDPEYVPATPINP